VMDLSGIVDRSSRVAVTWPWSTDFSGIGGDITCITEDLGLISLRAVDLSEILERSR
jgi:hypothetical protein